MANSWDAVVGTPAYLDVLRWAEGIAASGARTLNPDMERQEKVLGLMTMNRQATGTTFCPCRQSHPLDPDHDVVCPCPELEEDVARDGHCFCRLFYG